MAKPDLQRLRVNPNSGEVLRDDGKLGLDRDTRLAQLPNAANDAAAAALGVPVGGLYRNGSALHVRVS